MVRPAQTARSERTREALRQAAVVRFLAQGVEDTSAEQIAGDAGVSLRTFYRHFASKHDLLFADYDAGLHWFRSALAARSPDESIIESVQSAIMASPYDDWAVTNAIQNGNTKEALRQLALALDAGAVSYQVLGQLAWFVRDKLSTTDPRRIPAAVEALFRADLDLKSSGGDPRVLLERLVVELCGGALGHPARQA